jgi:hypothetical protein
MWKVFKNFSQRGAKLGYTLLNIERIKAIELKAEKTK